MRLIDADELIKSFKEFENDEASKSLYGEETLSLILSDCIIDVEKQPTVYKADEVVEQLEEQVLLIKEQLLDICEKDEEAVRLRCRMRGLDEAIEIVKAEMKG